MYYIALYWTQEGRVGDALSAGSDAEGGKLLSPGESAKGMNSPLKLAPLQTALRQ